MHGRRGDIKMGVIQVRLREEGKVNVYKYGNINLKPGDYVILEADRGIDYGQVVSEPEEAYDKPAKKEGFKKIIRKAFPQDLARIKKNKQRVKKALLVCDKKVKYNNLDMKLVDAEYSFDRSKIVFYFTSEGRVDFRNLVKELAQIFKLRIELRQIGARDEAKILGGVGPCGRDLCCATYMKNFEPVSIKMAKKQEMPLTPNKVSGLCGRLMCCLGYEYDYYKKISEYMPKKGEIVEIKEGKAKVLDINILEKKIEVEIFDTGKTIRLEYGKHMKPIKD